MASDPEHIKTIPDNYSRYLPLDHARKEIRLATLHGGAEESEIVFSLKYISLADPRGNIWECLSYCWGDLGDTRTVYFQYEDRSEDGGIEVARQPFTVRVCLESALRSLRPVEKCRVMWIDALSIDQSNLVECGQQVGLIREVYARADWVAVWLGESGEAAEDAVLLMQELTVVVEDAVLKPGQRP